uniref:AT-hook DNA binding motif containing 1 n=1 Tax=Hucho hucho TaxID=62062 RepID=A0A4W5NBC2_9TELE
MSRLSGRLRSGGGGRVGCDGRAVVEEQGCEGARVVFGGERAVGVQEEVTVEPSAEAGAQETLELLPSPSPPSLSNGLHLHRRPVLGTRRRRQTETHTRNDAPTHTPGQTVIGMQTHKDVQMQTPTEACMDANTHTGAHRHMDAHTHLDSAGPEQPRTDSSPETHTRSPQRQALLPVNPSACTNQQAAFSPCSPAPPHSVNRDMPPAICPVPIISSTPLDLSKPSRAIGPNPPGLSPIGPACPDLSTIGPAPVDPSPVPVEGERKYALRSSGRPRFPCQLRKSTRIRRCTEDGERRGERESEREEEEREEEEEKERVRRIVVKVARIPVNLSRRQKSYKISSMETVEKGGAGGDGGLEGAEGGTAVVREPTALLRMKNNGKSVMVMFPPGELPVILKRRRGRPPKQVVPGTPDKTTGGNGEPKKPRRRRRAKLPSPQPSYVNDTNDVKTEYGDVLSKLAFLNRQPPATGRCSPPRCWTPSEPDSFHTPSDNPGISALLHRLTGFRRRGGRGGGVGGRGGGAGGGAGGAGGEGFKSSFSDFFETIGKKRKVTPSLSEPGLLKKRGKGGEMGVGGEGGKPVKKRRSRKNGVLKGEAGGQLEQDWFNGGGVWGEEGGGMRERRPGGYQVCGSPRGGFPSCEGGRGSAYGSPGSSRGGGGGEEAQGLFAGYFRSLLDSDNSSDLLDISSPRPDPRKPPPTPGYDSSSPARGPGPRWSPAFPKRSPKGEPRENPAQHHPSSSSSSRPPYSYNLSQNSPTTSSFPKSTPPSLPPSCSPSSPHPSSYGLYPPGYGGYPGGYSDPGPSEPKDILDISNYTPQKAKRQPFLESLSESSSDSSHLGVTGQGGGRESLPIGGEGGQGQSSLSSLEKLMMDWHESASGPSYNWSQNVLFQGQGKPSRGRRKRNAAEPQTEKEGDSPTSPPAQTQPSTPTQGSGGKRGKKGKAAGGGVGGGGGAAQGGLFQEGLDYYSGDSSSLSPLPNPTSHLGYPTEPCEYPSPCPYSAHPSTPSSEEHYPALFPGEPYHPPLTPAPPPASFSPSCSPSPRLLPHCGTALSPPHRNLATVSKDHFTSQYDSPSYCSSPYWYGGASLSSSPHANTQTTTHTHANAHGNTHVHTNVNPHASPNNHPNTHTTVHTNTHTHPNSNP